MEVDSEDVLAVELSAIEWAPLDQRAARYRALAERLQEALVPPRP